MTHAQKIIEDAIRDRAEREELWDVRLDGLDIETMSEEIAAALGLNHDDPLDKAAAALDAAKGIIDRFEGDSVIPNHQYERINILLVAAQIHTNTKIALETGRLADATEANSRQVQP